MTGDRLAPLCLPLPGHRNPNSCPSAHEISILPSELQTYILTFTEVQLENDFFYIEHGFGVGPKKSLLYLTKFPQVISFTSIIYFVYIYLNFVS